MAASSLALSLFPFLVYKSLGGLCVCLHDLEAENCSSGSTLSTVLHRPEVQLQYRFRYRDAVSVWTSGRPSTPRECFHIKQNSSIFFSETIATLFSWAVGRSLRLLAGLRASLTCTRKFCAVTCESHCDPGNFKFWTVLCNQDLAPSLRGKGTRQALRECRQKSASCCLLFELTRTQGSCSSSSRLWVTAHACGSMKSELPHMCRSMIAARKFDFNLRSWSLDRARNECHSILDYSHASSFEKQAFLRAMREIAKYLQLIGLQLAAASWAIPLYFEGAFVKRLGPSKADAQNSQSLARPKEGLSNCSAACTVVAQAPSNCSLQATAVIFGEKLSTSFSRTLWDPCL